MIDQILSDQVSKQLIHGLDCSIGLNIDFVLAMTYEIRLLKLNCSKLITVYCFLFKINNLLHQLASVKYSGDSLTYKTRMDLK